MVVIKKKQIFNGQVQKLTIQSMLKYKNLIQTFVMDLNVNI